MLLLTIRKLVAPKSSLELLQPAQLLSVLPPAQSAFLWLVPSLFVALLGLLLQLAPPMKWVRLHARQVLLLQQQARRQWSSIGSMI
jgi:hypothetical protein